MAEKEIFYENIMKVATLIEREISDEIKNLKTRQLTSFEDIIAHDTTKWLWVDQKIQYHDSRLDDYSIQNS